MPTVTVAAGARLQVIWRAKNIGMSNAYFHSELYIVNDTSYFTNSTPPGHIIGRSLSQFVYGVGRANYSASLDNIGDANIEWAIPIKATGEFDGVGGNHDMTAMLVPEGNAYSMTPIEYEFTLNVSGINASLNDQDGEETEPTVPQAWIVSANSSDATLTGGSIEPLHVGLKGVDGDYNHGIGGAFTINPSSEANAWDG